MFESNKVLIGKDQIFSVRITALSLESTETKHRSGRSIKTETF